MRPLLAYGADGQEKNIRAAISAIADELQLTDDDRRLLVPSGKQTLLDNRVHWARTYLDKAGALKRTRRSHFVVTDRGKELLKQYPDKIDGSVLQQFPEFLAFKNAKAQLDSGEEADQSEDQVVRELPSVTPEDMIETAEAAISEKLRTQLLDHIQEQPPSFFERLVIDLIIAMGYGGSRNNVVQELGKSGDEGIDGVVNEDPLGLDVVYVQAKRYASENTVGRERVQQFAGALVGRGASKGVFVTTSSFSSGAVEYAKRVPQRIILIDGSELTRLMMKYGVGVRTDRTVEIKRIDLGYFEEAED
jgi:restriction system protein